MHAEGLKFGLYVTPGIPENAVRRNTPIEGTSDTADQIANTSVTEVNYNCGHMYGINYAAPGAQDYIVLLPPDPGHHPGQRGDPRQLHLAADQPHHRPVEKRPRALQRRPHPGRQELPQLILPAAKSR